MRVYSKPSSLPPRVVVLTFNSTPPRANQCSSICAWPCCPHQSPASQSRATGGLVGTASAADAGTFVGDESSSKARQVAYPRFGIDMSVLPMALLVRDGDCPSICFGARTRWQAAQARRTLGHPSGGQDDDDNVHAGNRHAGLVRTGDHGTGRRAKNLWIHVRLDASGYAAPRWQQLYGIQTRWSRCRRLLHDDGRSARAGYTRVLGRVFPCRGLRCRRRARARGRRKSAGRAVRGDVAVAHGRGQRSRGRGVLPVAAALASGRGGVPRIRFGAVGRARHTRHQACGSFLWRGTSVDVLRSRRGARGLPRLFGERPRLRRHAADGRAMGRDSDALVDLCARRRYRRDRGKGAGPGGERHDPGVHGTGRRPHRRAQGPGGWQVQSHRYRRNELMVSSRAASVAVYLDELPAERRVVVAAVRDLVLRNLQSGFVECMGFGMIGYVIPLARYPVTYNKQPLCYVALAAQKNSYSLYLMGAYADPHKYETLQAAYAKAGKKFDMGK